MTMTTAARPRGRPLRATAGAPVAAAVLPVARVLVDVSLAHLDRPYDYLVAEQDAVAAQPGVRVRVRFAGRLVNGYIVQRLAESDHPGRLGYLERVVSAEPVLLPEVAELARAVADRYAGSVADVLRLAVPPRHARTEGSADPPDGAAVAMDAADPGVPAADAAGPRLTDALAAPAADLVAAAPLVDLREAAAPAAPVADLREAAAPAAPVADLRVAGAPAAPVADLRVAGAPAAPVADLREAAVPAAPVVDIREAAAPAAPPASVPVGVPSDGSTEPAGWQRYPAGPAFLNAVRERRPARAVWQALPGEDWPARLAEAAAAADLAGHGALLIVPDARDLARLDGALSAALGAGRHVTLSADLGPAERYRRFLSVSRGEVKVVAGTRAAVFAPVADLALVAVFDDGDDLLIEPRAPYPHAREVLMLRSAARSCALLVGGFARTAEAQMLVESGWARGIVAGRRTVRAAGPRIEAAGEDYSTGADSAAARARLSPAAFAAAREALRAGAPVLVQVPRRGYLPALACTRCRRRAQCRHCRGPLALSGPGGLLGCRWCGVAEAHYRCGACGSADLRAVSVGAGRTAEEIGRAFPGAKVINSSGSKVRAGVPDAPAVVIATPGAEPIAPGGYGAALLLDGSAMLGRPDLRAAEETLRRWMAVAALVRPASAGGRVIVGADASMPVVQALIRWDPEGHAAAELAARRELGFPPAAAMASIEGDGTSVLAALDRLVVPPGGEVLGPVPLDDADDEEGPKGPPRKSAAGKGSSGRGASGEGPAGRGAPANGSAATGGAGAGSRLQRSAADAVVGSGATPNAVTGDPEEPQLRAFIRVPQRQRKALSAELHAVAAGRSARKEGGGLKIRVDPLELF